MRQGANRRGGYHTFYQLSVSLCSPSSSERLYSKDICCHVICHIEGWELNLISFVFHHRNIHFVAPKTGNGTEHTVLWKSM